MADDALELVKLRNNFYRDNYRRLVVAVLLLIIVNLALVGGIVYLLTHRPAPQYFATSADGRITPLYSLNEPVVSPPELLQWVNQAVVAAYSYSFTNYRKEFQDVAQFFTPDGWTQFQNELKVSRNLETVIAKKFVVTATPTGAPIISDQGILNGSYAWRIKMPVLVTYQNQQEVIQQPLDVTILVVRVSNLDTPKGIAIAQFIAAEKPLTGQTR